MTRKDAIEAIKCNWPDSRYTILREALDMAISALKEQDAADKDVGNNEPLTPDELQEMDGEPVYIVDGDVAWWDIVSFSLQGWLYLAKGKQFRYSRYGEWLAYRQKPEEDKHFICGATNLPCIRCNPGGCNNRKEGADNG